jgi:hypothetical protein
VQGFGGVLQHYLEYLYNLFLDLKKNLKEQKEDEWCL